MLKVLQSFILVTIALLVFSSCHKKVTFTSTQRAALIFHIHSYINDTKVSPGQMAYDDSGRRYQVNVGRFYISQVTFHNTDGTDWQSYGKFTLVLMGNEEYLIDSVPVGDYRSLSFTVGIDGTTNTSTPDQYATGNPLSAQNPSMWFGPGQGYIFMNIQGKADTTAAQNGPLNVSFNYQIGTDDLARVVNMPNRSFSMVAYQSQVLDVKMDYSVFLQSLNFKTQASCTPFTDQVLSTTLANRIPKMFSWGL